MAQWLRALPEDPGSIPRTNNGSSHLSVTPVPEDLTYMKAKYQRTLNKCQIINL